MTARDVIDRPYRELTQNHVVFREFALMGVSGGLNACLPDRSSNQTSCRLVDLFAQRARGKSVHLYTDTPGVITKIDVQLDDVVRRLTARRVTHPGEHLRSTGRYDAQRFQRERQSRLVGFGSTPDQSNRSLQRTVHQTWMKDIVSRVVRHRLRQPQLRQ